MVVRVTRIWLVRHGRAAAGWDADLDPGLDEIGRRQAVEVLDRIGPLDGRAVLSSPLRRCQETAAPLSQRWGVVPVIEPAVAEIPSPDGVPMSGRVEWLRAAMQGTWSDLGPRYTAFRDGVVGALLGLPSDAIVFSHFVAINAVIGAATNDDRLVIRSLDNCSVTVVEVIDGQLHLVEGGHEGDTLIR
jgi:broad specificity phosphatase PhoE